MREVVSCESRVASFGKTLCHGHEISWRFFRNDHTATKDASRKTKVRLSSAVGQPQGNTLPRAKGRKG